MGNQKHVALLKQGVEVWNQWREQHPEVQPDLREADLHGAYLSWADLSEADLRGANLQQANLEVAYLQGADLSFANLTEANLVDADLEQACLRDARLIRVDLRAGQYMSPSLDEADLRNADLTEAHLEVLHMEKANLQGARLIRTHLQSAWLNSVDLTKADVTEADLDRAHLRWTVLRKTNLTHANLRGVDLSMNDLRNADLTGAMLARANLSSARLNQANLSGADLQNANLREANLTGARLSSANLSNADLSQSSLNGADFSLTNLTEANLCGVDLSSIDLRQANLSNAILTDDRVTHQQRSSVSNLTDATQTQGSTREVPGLPNAEKARAYALQDGFDPQMVDLTLTTLHEGLEQISLQKMGEPLPLLILLVKRDGTRERLVYCSDNGYNDVVGLYYDFVGPYGSTRELRYGIYHPPARAACIRIVESLASGELLAYTYGFHSADFYDDRQDHLFYVHACKRGDKRGFLLSQQYLIGTETSEFTSMNVVRYGGTALSLSYKKPTGLD